MELIDNINRLTRTLAYVEAFQLGMRQHFQIFPKYPPKKVTLQADLSDVSLSDASLSNPASMA